MIAQAILGQLRVRRWDLLTIGHGTILDDFTYISGKVTIGAHCHISSNCALKASKGIIQIGDFVGLADGCKIYAATSDYLTCTMDLPSAPDELLHGGAVATTTISDYCLLGANTVILPGCNLPPGLATAAGTILRNKKYEPWTLYAGHDGRRIRHRQASLRFLDRMNLWKRSPRKD